MGLRSDSYPDPAGIDARARHMKDEAGVNKYVYWTDTGPTITDPRVERSWGGGMMPEQHWGYLKDGRCFYLRLRHAHASLQLGPAGLDPNIDLPLVNPDWNREEFEAALDAGEPYSHPFWLQPRPEVNVYPDDDWVGNFRTDEDLQNAFTLLLDVILEEF